VLSGKQNSEHFCGKLVSFWGGFAPDPTQGLRPRIPLPSAIGAKTFFSGPQRGPRKIKSKLFGCDCKDRV